MPLNLAQFRKQLTYQDCTSGGVILQTLREIAEVDRWAQKQIKKFTFLLFSFASLGFVTLLISSSLLQLVVLGFVIGGVLFSITRLAQLSRLDVPDLRHHLPRKILQLLNRDRNGATDVKIHLDFRSSTDPRKKVEEGPHPYRRGWKVKIFEDKWLTLSGEFLDRTLFDLSIAEVYKTSSGWKKSRSGKSKHKSKTKFKGTFISLRLKYPPQKYGAAKVLKQEASEAIKLPGFANLKRIKVTDRAIFLAVKIGDRPSYIEGIYETISVMFLSLYQILNLAKILAKKTKV